jgi:hypothetical protein
VRPCAVAYLSSRGGLGDGLRYDRQPSESGEDHAIDDRRGFILVPVTSLMAAWRACRSKPLGIGDFRAWLATHEMEARRCKLADGRTATYTLAELAGLLGVTRKRAGASVRRLEGAGLLGWSDSAIQFPEQADDEVCESFGDTIGRGRGAIAIPRRVLNHLTRGARPALIATVLGVLLRCLSRRRSGFDGRGRVKAGWIARVFGVDLRGVKRARRELVELGWISAEPSDAWATRRWGATYRIDLEYNFHLTSGSRLPPIPATSEPAIATPRSDREPLRERIRNQEPVSAGPAGVQTSKLDEEGRKLPEAGPLPPPWLDDVRVEDLKDTGRLLDLHGQALARGVVTSSEADRLRFVGAAEHALAIGRGNPPGLVAFLVRGRCWRYLTGDDEDRANARLKAHCRSPVPPVARPGLAPHNRPVRLAPSDAEVVRSVRAAAIRAGIFRDPFPEFAKLHPGWTRGRWDQALEGRQIPGVTNQR